MIPSDRHFSRVGSVAALLGIAVYAVSAALHPGTPPHETVAAFADYATEPNWALIHIGELLGILLMTAAAIALAWRLRGGVAGVWAILGAAAMAICASVYAVFTAVDGVGIGIMTRRWAGAAPDQQGLLFETAYAVRQVEAGLFSLQWFMFGVAAACFAVAFFAGLEPSVRRWLSGMGWLSVVASLGAMSFAIVQARTGFSDLSMTFQVGLYPGVLWILCVGVFLHRYPERRAAEPIGT